jgi:hypothetical protein
MHLAMLYEEVGKSLPEGYYDVDGWPREQVKRAILIAINAPTKRKCISALAEQLRKMDATLSYAFPRAEALLKAVKAKHSPIAHAFGSDAGARLMRKDSDLADKVMTQMLQATGIVPLVCHDSFIVPVTKEQNLQEIMEREGNYRTKISRTPGGMFPQKAGGMSAQKAGGMLPPFVGFILPKLSMIYSKDVPQYGPRCSPLGDGGGWASAAVVASVPVRGWLHYGVRSGDVVERFNVPWSGAR